MDEEQNVEVEVQDTVSEEKKGFDFNKLNPKNIDFKNLDYKKCLPYAGVVIAVIVLIIILVSVFGGGPKKAVKAFISGANSKNAKKVVNSIDIAGMQAWGYRYDVKDFSSKDYKEFVKEYKDIDKDEVKEYKEEMIDEIEESFDDLKDEYKSYKMKIEKIKSTKKLGKDLYAVEAKISVLAKPKDKDEKELDASSTMTFVVYKNKLISLGGLSF